MVFKPGRAPVFGGLGCVRLVKPYKGALCKEPFIMRLKWAMGEEPFRSCPQVITIKPGYDRKLVRNTRPTHCIADILLASV